MGDCQLTYAEMARRAVLREVRELRDSYEAGYKYDDEAISILDALIRRVERWDE